MTRIEVPLGARSYAIHVGWGILERAADLILEAVSPTSVALLSHPHLARRYASPVLCGFERRGLRADLVEIPPGERHKTLASAARIYEALLQRGIDRRGLIVTLGGGVAGDLGGFVAATYLRGIPFAQIPTTLLAQVDASIGGKTGVDLPLGKNLVGAFHQPRGVIIDTETLRTLPARELRSGLAEVIKYGIICDSELFARLARDISLLLRRQPDALRYAIERSCRIKAGVIGEDETETGRRAILNFGHTVGHALETITGFRRYKHGEAIAIGMVSAAFIGEEAGITPSGVRREITRVLASARLPVALPGDISPEELLTAMKRDKKSVSGRIRFVLAREIGRVELVDSIGEDAALRALRRHQAG